MNCLILYLTIGIEYSVKLYDLLYQTIYRNEKSASQPIIAYSLYSIDTIFTVLRNPNKVKYKCLHSKLTWDTKPHSLT